MWSHSFEYTEDLQPASNHKEYVKGDGIYTIMYTWLLYMIVWHTIVGLFYCSFSLSFAAFEESKLPYYELHMERATWQGTGGGLWPTASANLGPLV